MRAARPSWRASQDEQNRRHHRRIIGGSIGGYRGSRHEASQPGSRGSLPQGQALRECRLDSGDLLLSIDEHYVGGRISSLLLCRHDEHLGVGARGPATRGTRAHAGADACKIAVSDLTRAEACAGCRLASGSSNTRSRALVARSPIGKPGSLATTLRRRVFGGRQLGGSKKRSRFDAGSISVIARPAPYGSRPGFRKGYFRVCNSR